MPDKFSGGDAAIVAAAEQFANERAPAAAGVGSVSNLDFPRGPRQMPNWEAVGRRTAPWYPRYADHFLVDGDRSMVTASADPVPQPPGPAKPIVAPLPGDRARAQIQPEIDRLSRQIDQLSDAVGSYSERHARYAAVDANYMKQARDMAEYAKPAFQALHIEVLNAYADERRRAALKSLYTNLSAAARAELWEVLADQASRLPGAPAARQEALKRASKLVPAVHEFAQNEFAEIMKGPAAIVQGDEQLVAEIQARMSAHVCELISGYTPLMNELPPFVTPYLTGRSCGAQ